MLLQISSRRCSWILMLLLKSSPLVNFPLHAEQKARHNHTHSCSLFCVNFEIIHSRGTEQNFQQHQLVTFATACWTKARSRLKVCEKVREWIQEPTPSYFMTDPNHNPHVFDVDDFKSHTGCNGTDGQNCNWLFLNLLNSMTKHFHLVVKFQ